MIAGSPSLLYYSKMSSTARQQFGHVLAARKQGIASDADESTPFADLKPEYYADAKLLSGAVLEVFEGYRDTHPPYGLVDARGNTVTEIQPTRRFGRWMGLEVVFNSTMRAAFNEADSPVPSCPYHEVIGRKLGRAMLDPKDDNRQGIDTLREVSAPGGLAAAALVVNLLKRMPAMKDIHGATEEVSALAVNSKRTLLSKPLSHPQQHAKAFVFTLVDGMMGTDITFDRDLFLPDGLIRAYTNLQSNRMINEAIGWSTSTEDFRLRANVRVANRLLGPEFEDGEHQITYPIGTRLGDIQVSEPTIGCPGSQMAYTLWDRAIEVATAEELWVA